ncbi:MAG: L,D-transpeptidase family protein [Bacteroidales bacterium]|nr:L,D-transpeptidase family protein [Bacteroidales bacterium]
MRKSTKFIIILILIPFIFKGEDLSYAYDKLFAYKASISAQIQSKLEELAVTPGIRIGGERFHNIEYVTNLYRRNNYQPFWTKWDYTEDAIAGFLSSYDDGLIPLDYHLEAILVIRNQLVQNSLVTDDKIRKAAGLELLITDGIIFYANHLLYGKIDPVTLEPTWNFGYAPIPDMVPATLHEYLQKRELMTMLHNFRPEAFFYDTLLSTLSRYRKIESQGGWNVVPTGGKIEVGNNDSRIPLIRNRLRLTGHLTSEEDSLSTLYDKVLEEDIRIFQATHGLDPDGVIGTGTFRELNIPVKQRIASIRVNIERVRWVALELPRSYLIVNIVGFWLVFVNGEMVIHEANVVVGRAYTKTPVFRDKIHYIEFNPTWTVPRSILKRDVIPKLKKDPEYLYKNSMVLLDSKGNEVPSSVLDIPNLTINKFPYIVRQQPGPGNALGVVKFMFPNKYDVYLHDTPSKNLFKSPSRAYSSGCVRVERPLDLAEILLAGTSWDRAEIDMALKTNQTTRVLLNDPLDILILYWTSGVDRNHRPFFAPDIYNRDQYVLKELDRLLR